MALYKICNICHKKVPYEAECSCNDKQKRAKYKEYKINRKDKREQQFYSSKPWRKLKITIEDRYKGMCLICLFKEQEIENNDVVHHIEELKGNWDKRLEEDNLVPLCNRHHKEVHIEYERDTKSKIRMKVFLTNLLKKYKNTF